MLLHILILCLGAAMLTVQETWQNLLLWNRNVNTLETVLCYITEKYSKKYLLGKVKILPLTTVQCQSL